MASKKAAAVAAVAAAPAGVVQEEAAEAPPAGFGLDDIGRFVPAEADPIVRLFTEPFTADNLWAALAAAAALGRKAEAFLLAGLPRGEAGPLACAAAAVPAVALTDEEVARHFLVACEEAAALHGPAATGEGVPEGAQPVAVAAVALNPTLAGLLVALAQRAAQELLRRLGGRRAA